jgi:hypothetical protein
MQGTPQTNGDRPEVTLQAERTELLHALNSWAWQQVTPEEARCWAEDEEEGLTFDELLHSLDQGTKT